jgi:hypothetical protein
MDKHSILVALGPGGTTELAERVLELLAAQMAAVETVLGELELGGLAEVCELLGRSRQTVGHWAAGRRMPRMVHKVPPRFPDPIVHLSATPVWDLATVRAWAADVGLVDSSKEPIRG